MQALKRKPLWHGGNCGEDICYSYHWAVAWSAQQLIVAATWAVAYAYPLRAPEISNIGAVRALSDGTGSLTPRIVIELHSYFQIYEPY